MQPISETTPTPKPELRLRFQLISFTIIRTIMNTGYRLPYPFVPIIAAGLGMPLEAITSAVGAARLLGVASPVLGAAADRLGRKTAMLLGISIFTLGLGVVAVSPSYPSLVASVLLIAGGKIIFDPAMYAYLGDRVTYAQRGLATAIVEMGWSGAFLIGMPLAGIMIDRGGWAAPFPLMTLAGIASILILWRILPGNAAHAPTSGTLFNNLKTVLTNPTALAGLAMGFSMNAANETIGITFSTWLRSTFSLEAAMLAGVATVIGVAELGGEGLVAGLVDRIGKRRAVIAGSVLNGLACLLLPFMNQSLIGAMVGLFLIFITFEFALVASIPLMTEILPEARTTLMATNVSSLSAGRALGAFIGPLIFGTFGLLGTGITAAAFDAVIIILLLFAIRQD